MANETDLAISFFLQSLRKEKRNEKTVTAYASDIAGLLHHLGLNSQSLDLATLAGVQIPDLRSYLGKLTTKGLKIATVKRRAAAIRKFFSFLCAEGILKHDPSAALSVRPATRAVLSANEILSAFRYLLGQQQSEKGTQAIRYRRDELILMLMLFYGVRQYQIAALRLSCIEKLKTAVTLSVNRDFVIRLDRFVMEKLRAYLAARRSNADTIFLEPARKKPVDHSIIKIILTELSFAVHVNYTPRLLHNTFLHLQQNPGERRVLIERIIQDSSAHTYGAAANA
jgi:site-specific recombinase XerD